MYSSTLVREGQLTVMSPSSGGYISPGKVCPRMVTDRDISRQGPHEIRFVLRNAGRRGIEAAIRDAGHGQRIDPPHGLHDHAHVFDDLKIPAVHVQHVAVSPIHALIVGVPLRHGEPRLVEAFKDAHVEPPPGLVDRALRPGTHKSPGCNAHRGIRNGHGGIAQAAHERPELRPPDRRRDEAGVCGHIRGQRPDRRGVLLPTLGIGVERRGTPGEPHGPHVFGHDPLALGLHGFNVGNGGKGVRQDDALNLGQLHSLIHGVGPRGNPIALGVVQHDGCRPVLPPVVPGRRHLSQQAVSPGKDAGQVAVRVHREELPHLVALPRADKQQVVFHRRDLPLREVEIVDLHFADAHNLPRSIFFNACLAT